MTETITTAEARDALPPGVIVRSAAGTIACRHDGGMGVCFGVERPFEWDRLALPLTVLYRPDRPAHPTVQPTLTAAREAAASAVYPRLYWVERFDGADAVAAVVAHLVGDLDVGAPADQGEDGSGGVGHVLLGFLCEVADWKTAELLTTARATGELLPGMDIVTSRRPSYVSVRLSPKQAEGIAALLRSGQLGIRELTTGDE